MALTIAELRVAISAETSALAGGLNSAVAASTSAAQKAGDAWRKAGAAMTNVGQQMQFGIGAPLANIAKEAMKTAADFEQSMNVLKAATGASATQMAQASKLAIQLGKDTTLPGTSANDAAAAMLKLTQHGLTLNQAMQASKGVLQLSAAAHISNAQAATFAASALNSFKRPASEAVRVADMLAAAHLASGVTVQKLGMSVRNGAQAFASAGVPMEHFMTALALMAKNGIAGEKAGTGLASMLQRLRTSDVAAAAMRTLHFSLYDINHVMKPLPQVFSELQARIAQLRPDEAAKKMKDLFGTGQSSFSAGNIMLKSAGEAWAQMNQKMTAGGQAAKLSEAQMKGLNGAIENLKSAYETFLLVAGKPFLETLTGMLKRLGELVDWMGQLPAPVRNAAIGFGLFMAAAGPVLIFVGNLVQAMTSLGPVMSAVRVGLVGLRVAFLAINPVLGIITIAVAAFAAAWAGNWFHIREVTQSVVNWIVLTFTQMPQKLTQLGKAMGEGLVNGVKSTFGTVKKTVTDFGQGIVDTVKTTLGIRSPSVVFAKIGMDMMEGLSVGARSHAMSTANVIADAVRMAAQKANEAQREAMSNAMNSIESLRLEITKMTAQSPADQAALELFKVKYDQLNASAKQLVNTFMELSARKAMLGKENIAISIGGGESASPGIVGNTGISGRGGIATTDMTMAGNTDADPTESRWKKHREGAKTLAEEFNARLNAAFNNLTNGNMRNFFGSLMNQIGSMFKSIGQQFLQQVMQAIALWATNQMFGKAAGAGISGPNGLPGGMLNTALSFLPGGGAIGGILGGVKKLFHFADGGIPPLGVPSLVGERGPELFVPSSAGRIIPNHALGAPQNVTVTNQFYGPISHEADENRLTGKINGDVQKALRLAF